MSPRNLAILLICLSSPSCAVPFWQAKTSTELKPPDVDAPFLKVHTPDGDVFVLESWKIDDTQRVVTGAGIHYNTRRDVVERGPLTIPFDRVALLETNRPETVKQPYFAVIGVVGAVSLAGTAFCAISPKSCFGSCPTFYTPDGHLVAEGFSASIARALEAQDVDALWEAHPQNGHVQLRMVNEAVETQVVQYTRLLAAEKPAGGRVLRQGEKYWAATHFVGPLQCLGLAGDCITQLATPDFDEYHSTSDGVDLASRETVELSFPPGEGALGLAISGRTSLISTFIFYQALAYMGENAGRWQTRLEYGLPHTASAMKELMGVLGDIQVEVLTRSGWEDIGTFSEYGPIARETQVLPLPADLPPGPVQVRLDMTRGGWRLDMANLVQLGAQVTPTLVELANVVGPEGSNNGAVTHTLRDPDTYLFTYPGDEYTLDFQLPESINDAELFLDTRGYYYEWMRTDWLPEEDPEKVVLMLGDTDRMLKELAPVWKTMEDQANEVFWNSRVGRPE